MGSVLNSETDSAVNEPSIKIVTVFISLARQSPLCTYAHDCKEWVYNGLVVGENCCSKWFISIFLILVKGKLDPVTRSLLSLAINQHLNAFLRRNQISERSCAAKLSYSLTLFMT